MSLMLIYVVLVAAGEVVAIQLGLYLDTAMPSLSLTIALSLFFSVLVVMWPISVWIYERFLAPKAGSVADAETA